MAAVLAVVIAACYLGFWALAGVARRAESAIGLALVGDAGWVGRRARGGFRIDSRHGVVHVPFSAYCSSLIALIGVAACGLLIVRAPWARRYTATAIAVATVLAWSGLRLAASFWIIRITGHSASWLFDDWFGILLVLIDTAIGYHLMIWLMLPARRAP